MSDYDISVERARSTSPFGITPPEARRLTAGVDVLRRHGAGILITCAPLRDEGAVRDMARDVKNRLALIQRRAGMARVLHATVFEGEPRLHAHIVAPLPSNEIAQKIVLSLNTSRAFRKHGDSAVDARLVDDWDGISAYLLKEATPQTWHACGRAFPRLPGSRALGDGGGDRVVLSPDLEDALVRSGVIEPRLRTYASRALSRPTKSRRARAIVEGENQLVLFEQLSKPVARLREWTDGVAPPVAVQELEFLRRRRGWTQEEIARRAGLSRPAYANIVKRRFGAAEWAVQRLREALACAGP